MLTHASLAQALLDAVRAQHFEHTADAMCGGAALRHFPSIDLAVVAFPSGRAPVWANVLFSREHPQGLVADIPADAGAVRNLRYLADMSDDQRRSIAWWPDSDWAALPFVRLAGSGPHRFVAPYPASLFKLMVAVGVARAIDAGAAGWSAAWQHGELTRSVADWCEDMIATSDDAATTALTAWLHAHGAIERDDAAGIERRNDLHAAFEACGLATLRFANTRADGGWGNNAGAGVGHLQMTAWDAVRLLWLLDAQSGAPPWCAGQPPLVSDAGRKRLLGFLQAQGLHEVLSSTVLAGVPGWQPGLPAQLPMQWVDPHTGAADVKRRHYPGDVRAANARAEVTFAHKTGTTENYASDGGIVRGLAPRRRHYLIAVLTNLGLRYAPHPACATTWRLPALGRAVDAWLALRLE
jgi:hypothetical protein